MPQIPVPLIRGHLQCRDTFAWPDRCPYKTGSTVMQNSLALSDPKIAQNSKFKIFKSSAPPSVLLLAYGFLMDFCPESYRC